MIIDKIIDKNEPVYLFYHTCLLSQLFFSATVEAAEKIVQLWEKASEVATNIMSVEVTKGLTFLRYSGV